VLWRREIEAVGSYNSICGFFLTDRDHKLYYITDHVLNLFSQMIILKTQILLMFFKLYFSYPIAHQYFSNFIKFERPIIFVCKKNIKIDELKFILALLNKFWANEQHAGWSIYSWILLLYITNNISSLQTAIKMKSIIGKVFDNYIHLVLRQSSFCPWKITCLINVPNLTEKLLVNI
jgi:hypothetical protein